MKINVYKAAILIFTIQSILIAILVNNNYMKKYSFLQFPYQDQAELYLGIFIFLLNLAAAIVVRKLYLSGLEAEQLHTTVLKYAHLGEQNRIYRQHHHDLKNHLTVILGLLTLGKYDDLKDYLNSYLSSINDSLLKIESGLDEIDVLLSSKYFQAKSNEIQLDLMIKTTINCSRKHAMGLVSILGNLLDNALEAVQSLNQPQRAVKILIQADPLDYIFMITNPLPRSGPIEPELFLKEGFSTKGEGRGQGLYTVKKLTEGLGGSIAINTENSQFEVTIELPKYRLED